MLGHLVKRVAWNIHPLNDTDTANMHVSPRCRDVQCETLAYE